MHSIGVIEFLAELSIPTDSELLMNVTGDLDRDRALAMYVEDINSQILGSRLDLGDQEDAVLLSALDLPGGVVMYK